MGVLALGPSLQRLQARVYFITFIKVRDVFSQQIKPAYPDFI